MKQAKQGHASQSTEKHAHGLLSGGRFALGLMIGVVTSVAAYLFFSTNLASLKPNEIFDFLPSILALIVVTVAVTISQLALIEQRRMRQAGTDPVILVYLSKRQDEPSMVMLKISNVGAGAAKNITLDFDKRLPQYDSEAVITDFRSLKSPIKVIPQSESVDYHSGVGFRLLGDSPFPPFSVQASYLDIEDRLHTSIHEIDVRELTAQAISSPPLTRIAKSLERTSSRYEKMGDIIEVRILKEPASQAQQAKVSEKNSNVKEQ